MSSLSEDHSESEESCEELEEPPKVTKIANPEGTTSDSESDHSDKSKNTSTSKTNKNRTVAALIPEDSELSDSESDASVGKNKKPKTSSGFSTPSVKHNKSSSGSESDSSAGSVLTHKIKLEKKSSSDEASTESKSSSSKTFNKKVHKFDRSRGGNDSNSEVSDTHTDHAKQESSSELSSEDESSVSKTSSSKGNKRTKLFAQTKREMKSASKSSDTDDGSSRKADESEDEDDPENTKVQPSIQRNMFSFSEKNLINHSSGLIDLETLSNNDLWLIHSPKVISDEDLQGASINLSSGAHHKIGKQKYQISLYPEKGAVACVLPSKKAKEFLVVGLPVKGSAVFEESVKLPKPIKPQLTSEGGLKFPENLKVRHPLFGADYMGRLSRSLELKRRMKSSEKRKSKGKERFANGNESVASSETLLETKLDKSFEKQKKRNSISDSHSAKVKSQREHRGSVSEKNGFVNSESPSKSLKKRKRDKVDDGPGHGEFVESSQIKKRKVIKSEDDAGLNESVSSSKRKKRKVETSEEQLYQTPSVKESSKNSGLEDTFVKTLENIKEEVLSSSEMSLEGEMHRKKKKEKRKSKSDF